MQTFLPYPDFGMSARCLDQKRLGKQRVEAMQIINTLEKIASGEKVNGWARHPAVLMWAGHLDALKLYHNQCILAWVERGYKNSMELFTVRHNYLTKMPPWLGDEAFHASHRGTLLSKNIAWYSQFGWTEAPVYEYVWPEAPKA